MAKQTYSVGQVLTSAQMTQLQANDYNWTVSTKTDDYTFVAADKGTRVVANKASAIAFTVDDTVFTAGDTLAVSNINTGVLTLTAGAGVTINGADVLTVAQWQGGTLYFTSASSAIWFPTAKTVTSGVVQVKSATITGTYSQASTTFTNITGLEIAITPTSASNKVLVVASIMAGANPATTSAFFRLRRDSTDIGIGDTAGSRIRVSGAVCPSADNLIGNVPLSFLDSPNTTSAVTYRVQAAGNQAQTIGVNRSVADADSTNTPRGISTITVFEVTP